MKERKRPEAERRKMETAGQDGARVMSKEEFLAELEACLSVYAHLAQAMDDVKLGRMQAMDEAFDDTLSELDEVCP